MDPSADSITSWVGRDLSAPVKVVSPFQSISGSHIIKTKVSKGHSNSCLNIGRISLCNGTLDGTHAVITGIVAV